jgi:hypothetical protein
MGVIEVMAMFHIQSWKLCYIAKYHLLLQFIALGIGKEILLAVLFTAQLLILVS